MGVKGKARAGTGKQAKKKSTKSAGSVDKQPAKKSRRKAAGPSTSGPQRLQRVLALAGFGSRRQCEDLIEEGRVDVDGTIVTKLGTNVDPSVNKIYVDGTPLKKQRFVYYAVNKPVGVVTTNRDPQGRPRVIDLVPRDDRVFPVGRLDRSSEGLILLTNDGELAQKLTHPKFGVKKVYRVTVAGKADGETMRKMRNGIYIAEGHVKVDGARLLKSKGKATEMEIILREGKNREIRRILARLGHKVQHLRRIAVGPLRLGDMPAGAYRKLSSEEVNKLWASTETSAADAPAPERKKVAGKKRPTSRLPAKKKRATGTKKKSGSPVAKAKSFSLDAPRAGAVIGGDPETKSKSARPNKGKPGGSKRTSSKKASSSRSSKRGGRKRKG
ncbi:MAG: pseudouridine synthase [Rubripirellula sp.]